MPTRPRLELTWFGNEDRPNPRPRVRVAFPDDALCLDSPGRAFEADLQICGKPRCSCLNILFRWAPSPATGADATPPREFWLGLEESSIPLSSEQQQDPVLPRLAEAVRAELTDEGRQRLREWYLAAKLDLIERMPVAHIEIDDLPNADGGKLIGFVDVFPCGGLALNFRHNLEIWAVDEQYCVQPGCRCSNTVLSFFRLMDAAGRKTETISQAPTLRYDYQTETTKPLEYPAGMPSPQELLAVVKGGFPDLNTQLHRRHLIMQLLYLRHYLARSRARTQDLPRALASGSPLNVGRNDPCPCGSGRKFKHCCLNKSRP